jgi:glycosyltransferase involved in cell wall biosynthesis
MRNICFFNSISFWGGGEKLHLENALAFKHKGYEVSMLANPKSPLWEKATQHQIELSPIAVSNLSFLNPFKLLKLSSHFKKKHIDTVIISSSQDLKLGSLAAKLAGVKNIVYMRGLAVPVKASFINKHIYKSVLTHIISNSEETKKQILKHLHRFIPNEKVHTIYHGIEVDENTEPRLEIVQAKARGVILGNAGRLTEQKRQKDLIEVAKKLSDANMEFTLFIAGEGELHNELQSLIDTNGLQEKVILLGFVEEMDRFMNSIDIFLLPTAWEGFGFVLVEAMVKSKPVVAYSCNPEIVADGITGLLAEYPDTEQFAQKVIELINDPTLRKTMGAEGLKRVKEKFTLQDRIDEIEAYLK